MADEESIDTSTAATTADILAQQQAAAAEPDPSPVDPTTGAPRTDIPIPPPSPRRSAAELPGEIDVMDMFRTSVGRSREIEQERRETMEPLYGAMRERLAQPIEKPPQLREPPPSPKRQFGQDMFDFLQTASVLAVIGGALGRKHVTNALQAFSSSIDGFRQGKLDQAKIALEDWKAESQNVIDYNNNVVKRYEAILKNDQMDVTRKMQAIQLEATQFQDRAAFEAAQQGKITELARYIETVKWHNALMAQKDRALDVTRAKALAWIEIQTGKGSGPEGGLSESAVDAAAEQYLLTRQLPPRLGGGIQGRQDIRRVLNRAEELANERNWKAADIFRMQQDFRGRQTAINRTYTLQANLGTAANELISSAPAALEAIKNLPRGTPLFRWNALAQAYEAETSDPRLGDAAIKVNSVVKPYAIVANRGAPGTTESRQEANSFLGTVRTPEDAEARINAMVWEARNIRHAIATTRKEIFEGGLPPALQPPLPGKRPPGLPAEPDEDVDYTFDENGRLIKSPGR